MTTYGEYRQHQRDHERRCWQEASPEERKQRIQMRKEYLFAMVIVHPEWMHDLLECPHCEPNTVLPAGWWPRWFLCLNCDHVCVVDLNSHLTQDDQERIFIEPYQGLENRYNFYRWA